MNDDREQMEQKIWYATKPSFQSHWALFGGKSDKGILSISDEGVHFRGKRHDFGLTKIHNVFFVTKRLWSVFLIVSFLFFLLLGLVAAQDFDWIGGVFLLCLVVQLIAIIVGERWICVKYEGDDGGLHEAFFFLPLVPFNPQPPVWNRRDILGQLRKLVQEEKTEHK